MELSVIIVNWKSAAFLEACLRTLFGNPPRDCRFEVVVIDNASYDGAGQMLAQKFPAVRFIQSDQNLGFSGANNAAAAQSCGTELMFLNPDTEIEPGSIDALRQALSEGGERAGVIGARLLNTDRTVQTSCLQAFPSIWNQAIDTDFLRRHFPGWKVWGTRPLLEKQSGPVAVEVISGACMLVRRQVFEQVGGFTTAYFMYSEDVDLCYQIHHAGFTNYYTDDAVVIHHGGGSTNASGVSHFSAVQMKESRHRYFQLRRGPAYAFAYRASVAAISLLRCGLLAVGAVVAFGHRAELAAILSRWVSILRWSLGRPTTALNAL